MDPLLKINKRGVSRDFFSYTKKIQWYTVCFDNGRKRAN